MLVVGLVCRDFDFFSDLDVLRVRFGLILRNFEFLLLFLLLFLLVFVCDRFDFDFDFDSFWQQVERALTPAADRSIL